MFKALVLATVAVASVAAFTVDSANLGLAVKFQEYASKFNKQYQSTAEWDTAFGNFQKSLARIEAAEARGVKGVYGLTKFSDLSTEEFRSKYLMPKGSIDIAMMAKQFAVAKPKGPVGADPATFDWRSKHAVTPVKDQQQCGSCWAFSTTENFESMTFLAGNPIPTLGPQQLVDCDPQSQGCGGGWTYWAFQYLLSAGGQETEANYPYTAQDGNCAFDASKIAARLTNYTFATTPCESGSCPTQDDVLRHQLATVGPLSICVNAEIWSDWSGPSPLPASECPGDADELDHCVQLVGYNWPGNYWIVRNSWNTDWGVEGYIYLQTGANACGLGDVVTYADVPKKTDAPTHRHTGRKH
jgi:cathepsin F